MRLITDPIVDTVIYLLAKFLLPPIVHLAQTVFNVIFLCTLFLIGKVFGTDKSKKLFEGTSKLVGFIFTTSIQNVLSLTMIQVFHCTAFSRKTIGLHL